MTKVNLENSQVTHDDKKVLNTKWTIAETKLLIASVKEQPELYDPGNSKYKLLNFTEKLWTNFDLLLKKPIGACKERWGYLRHHFRTEYKDKRDTSQWNLYKSMLFLKNFLYSRGPTLQECIEKAKNGEAPSRNANIENESVQNNRMVTVMSPEICRNNGGDEENFNLSIQQEESIELRCEEEPRGSRDFTFAIPKLEPIEIENQLPHMSTPIIPRERLIVKRSLPSGIEIKKIKIQRVSETSNNVKQTPDVMQLKNVKIQKISTSPGQSEHYTLEQEKSIGAAVPRNNSNESIMNQTLKPHNFPACSCTADADMMFMQSLVPDLKKLNSRQRMDFKVQVHQLLQTTLYKK